MSPTPTYSPVPKVFAELAQTGFWTHCEYERTREGHLKEDVRTGSTCFYDMRQDPDIDKIQTLLGDEFAAEGYVNQHAIHSLRLAVWEAQKAFAEHQERLAALRGTAQGRTPMTHKNLTAVF